MPTQVRARAWPSATATRRTISRRRHGPASNAVAIAAAVAAACRSAVIAAPEVHGGAASRSSLEAPPGARSAQRGS
ncbi:hypothetical protein [Modestobacter sp. KNN46-3]|uniref:hypothetical protein n=1 Tax=Modestobacter sp. KNN46-3 TaxID=2711218 RepID=UPI0013E0E830|nr:hypothetical protein [Modestobacter sp. KNN46-3]